MTLRPIPVTAPAHVEAMRLIRNRCAAGFANFNEQITAEQQTRWWKANRDRVRAWLYAVDRLSHEDHAAAVCPPVVGFGLLTRHDDGTWWTTVGVDPAHTGSNFGKFVTSHLIHQAPGRVYGAARKDNPAAVRLHVEDEWVPIGEDERLVFFHTRKADPWPPEGATDAWAVSGWSLCR